MAKQLSILFVTSEVYPYAKETGLADVSYSLPLAMRELGHDIRVMTPKYGIVSERKNRIHEINRLRDMPIPMGEESEPATVKSSSISNPRNKVQAYITTNQRYFDKNKGIYHDHKTWKLFPDNLERFIFFSRSVVETCLLLGWFPDIIHCNDWQTAVIPAYLRSLFPSKFKKTRSILTIHNFAEQGLAPISMFAKTGLSKDILNNFKHKNQLNLLKGGIIYSNYITTVSPTYAKQILADKELSNGLNSTLKEHSSKFAGIMNGIDNYGWNPKSDIEIESKYDNDVDEYKYNNKVALINRFDLEYSPKIPLIGFVGKLEESKGVDLVIDSLPEMLQNNVQIVVLGQGSSEAKDKLESLAKENPEKLKVELAFDDSLAHKMEAGSDIFLLPSKNEACGLNLMYSLAYGAVPIVHMTGGFKDVAKQFNPDTLEGNSFTFEEFTKDAFMKAFGSALDLYKDKEKWLSIVANGMNGDYSWSESAAKYDEIYKNVMKEQMA